MAHLEELRTSIFKSVTGYWVTTTDNSGLSNSNLYLVDNEKFTWKLKKLYGNMGGVVVNGSNTNQIAFYTEATSNSDSGVFVSKDGGKTWDETEIDGSQFSAIAIIGSENTSTLYVAGRYFPNEKTVMMKTKTIVLLKKFSNIIYLMILELHGLNQRLFQKEFLKKSN